MVGLEVGLGIPSSDEISSSDSSSSSSESSSSSSMSSSSSSSEEASLVGLSFLAALAAEEVLSSRSETRPSFLRVLAKSRLVLALAMRADLIFWAAKKGGEGEKEREGKGGGKV